MTDLPPAAQEVLDAFLNGYACKPSCNVAFEADRNGIAAALRAAADQVAPEDYFAYTGNGDWDHGMEAKNDEIREAILAITDELEGTK